MATPRYIVKRIGNDYKVVRADTEGVVLSSLATLGGGLLVVNGLRGGFINKLLAIAGGGIVYYALSGNNPITQIQNLFNIGGSTSGDGGEEHGPSFQHDEHSTTNQTAEDEVDEASMESFPASDPPAHRRTTATAS